MSLVSFPRGGKKPELGKKSADVSSKKKPKRYMTESDSEDDKVYEARQVAKERFFITVADRLTKMTLNEGLTLLGRISEVKRFELIVSLPGGFVGYVQDLDVCQSYTTLHETIDKEGGPDQLKLLPDVFKPGDYVTCFVLEIRKALSENWICTLAMEPALINENIRSNYLVKGSKIICSVESIEDHGYVVDTGILNVTAFLATENVEKGKQYSLCAQLLCTIKEIEIVGHKTILKLSTKKKKIDSVNDHDEVCVDAVMPGTKFSLRITKLILNGLQVFFGKNNFAYVHQTYLKHPLSTYKPNKNVTVTLLYILRPNLAFFSELDDVSEKEKFDVGAIIEEAKVLYREANGAILQLSVSGLRGYVAFRRTNVTYDKIATVFKKGSIHKCRVLHYNWVDRLYICTMEEDILKEKYFSLSNLNIGDILTVTVTEVDTNTAFVKVGRLSGSVSQNHISDSGPSVLSTLKVGSNVEARVLNKQPLEFTMKQSLIKSKLPVLQDFSEVKCGLRYHGTVSLINKKGLLVRFYGKTVKGWVPHTTLNSDTRDMNWNFSVGQTVKVYVTSVQEEKQRMKLKIVIEYEEQSVNFSIGEIVEGTVTESSVKGVYLKIQEENSENFVTGFLPAGHMAPCIEVGNVLASRCPLGHVMSAFVYSTKPTLILSRTFVSERKYRNFDSLKVGDCILGTLREFSFDGMKLLLPIENYSKLAYIPRKDMCCYDYAHTYQMLFAKITAINKREKELTLVTSLKTVWDSLSDHDFRMMMGVDVLSMYLQKHSELGKMTYYKNKPISMVTLGQKVTATVEKIYELGYALRLDNQLRGVARFDHCLSEPKVGDKVFGVVMWKSYTFEIVELSLLPKVINSISSKQHLLPELPVATTLKAEILIINKWLVLTVVKRFGKGYLVAMPVRQHLNDTNPDLTPYKLHAKLRVYVILKKDESADMPICMLKSAFEHFERKEAPIENKQLKRKRVSESHDSDLANPPKKASKKVPKKALEEENGKESEIEEEIRRIKDIKYSESEEEFVDVEGIKEGQSAKRSCLPECGFSWNNIYINKAKLATPSETSSDDESESEEEFEQKKKKKKSELNATERRKQKRQEEREIHQEEEALASNQAVNSSDEFEKLVFSSPNSSLVWLKYMTYYMQNTEIEKARATIRRAIRTINCKEEIELLNIWKAWLNLESKFGTAESLNHVFREALNANDAYKIYIHMLAVHAEADRKIEFEKWVDKIVSKFKQDPQAWLDCGSELLTFGLKEKSRQLMQRAVQSLPATQHIEFLVRFAHLENRLGDKKRAQALFESILKSFPKRVDVWSCYVDCLIKSKNIDLARKVLKRACAQTLRPRKMRALFVKYIDFEEKYGTFEAAEHVRQVAADYVDKHNMLLY